MKRFLLLTFALGLLVFPAGASARVIELGSDAPAAKSNCPADPCEVVGRVSGYMGRAGAASNPFVVPRSGRIVAFTVALGKLEQNQISYFTNLYGGTPQVRLSILRRGKKRKSRLTHRLMAQSDLFSVQRYLGSTPTFALDEPLKVRKGYIVGISVPTWIPAFARGLPRSNWWRSSRSKGECDEITQKAAQQRLTAVRTYGCTYYTARLLYTATYVPDPRPTDGSERRRTRR